MTLSKQLTHWKKQIRWGFNSNASNKISRNLWLRLILGCTTFVVSTSAYYSYRVLRSLTLEKIEEKVLLKVQIRSDAIDGWLVSRRERVETFANMPRFQSLDWSSIEPYLQLEIDRQTDFFKFALVYSDGTRNNTVGTTRAKGNVGDRPFFIAAMAGRSSVNDPVISRSTGIPQINIAAPIWSIPPIDPTAFDRERQDLRNRSLTALGLPSGADVKPKPIGVLMGSVKTDRVKEVVNSLQYGQNSYAFALNSQGRAIVHPDPALMSTREKPAPSLLEAAEPDLAAIAGRMVRQERGLELAQIDGTWKYVAYMPFRETNWSIALVMPRETIESQLKLLDRVAVVILLLAGTLIIVLWQVQSFEQTQLKKSEAVLAEKNERLQDALWRLKQTQTQLVQTEKMSGLGQMVAGIAHEINNPVSFIAGNILHANDYTRDLLELIAAYQSEYPEPSPHLQDLAQDIELDFIAADLPKILNSMQMGSDRIRKIVLSLRNFSRLDESEMKPANIHEGIDSTVLILQHRLKAQPNRPEIQVTKKYGNLPEIECYPAQLNQVFMNLLTNAIDALDEAWQQRSPQKKIEGSSTITISTELQPDSRALISIADNGMGIAPDELSKIFNPFFTTKPIGKGTGLGLSVSYQIAVEKHGGQLWCESVLGRGTEFFIQIPVRQDRTDTDRPRQD